MSDIRTRGMIVASAAAVFTAAGTAMVFFWSYGPLLEAAQAHDKPDAARLLTYIFPMLTDLGLVSAALWGAAAAGFFAKHRWAGPVASLAALLGLMNGFVSIPPTASNGLFPMGLPALFLPVVVCYFLLCHWVLCLRGRALAIALVGACAFVFTFMMGIACTHRILSGWGDIYIFSQRVHFLLAISWAVFQVAFFGERHWAVPLGMGVSFAVATIGLPLAVSDSLALGRPSMFFLSPAVALLMWWLIRPHNRLMKNQAVCDS